MIDINGYRTLRAAFLRITRAARARIRRHRGLPLGGDPASGYYVDSRALESAREAQRNMHILRTNRANPAGGA